MHLKFSKIEIRDLTKAWICISIAFAIALAGGITSVKAESSFLLSILLAALTVGVGFLLHELGHKFIAQRYGCFAEFRSDTMMLGLAILTSFFGFIFAAPGAVMIAGRVSTARNGKISVAGPLVNVALAILFMILALLINEGFFGQLFAFGFFINTWLAIFNMLPLWILDGKKVWDWNKTVYISVMAFSIALLVMGQFLPFTNTI